MPPKKLSSRYYWIIYNTLSACDWINPYNENFVDTPTDKPNIALAWQRIRLFHMGATESVISNSGFPWII
jgi:hypothetical protein